jgi:hypothetical protein
VVVCPNPECKKENPNDSKFCVFCGKEILDVPAAASAGSTVPSVGKEVAKDKKEDRVESVCCAIASAIGVLGAVVGFLSGKSGYEIGYNLGGLFFLTWIVIYLIKGVQWIYKKIKKSG